ncbi:hypothetical protein GOQ27_08365 [Clostridium sp. D2Q-11]|uniref:Uncharacterized protein n=1 Tax=Anaeromonas frigoriresistens TaxID=2683708 RepID=A0A942Z6H5_9FIRM|nr:hypothetical protein [Anaeromonas frigoriresistens]MBS4538476.1 hypothetical protein [Anaeromonas frigoriresistens]
MKFKSVLLIFALLMLLFVGCGEDLDTTEDPETAEEQEEQPDQTTPPETEPDVMTTPSIVDTAEAFEKAISEDNGSWIIATTKDITFDKEISLDGEYKNGKKDDDGKDIIQRKIALYAQDEERNVTDRYTLTAPKLTINSPNARIQSGTFEGDLYVAAQNFELVDAKIEGDIYFTNENVQSTFTMDDTSEITGEQKLMETE